VLSNPPFLAAVTNAASSITATNSSAENFFGHVKEELFHHDRFDTVEESTTALDDYLDRYNTTHISTTLKGLSPVQHPGTSSPRGPLLSFCRRGTTVSASGRVELR
jgi:hypothetical protein